MKDNSVLHANLAVIYLLLLSVRVLGGETPLTVAVKSSHAKLNTSLLLSSLELAPAQLRGTIEWHHPASGGHQFMRPITSPGEAFPKLLVNAASIGPVWHSVWALSILPVSSTAQPDLDFHSFMEAKGAADNA